MSELEPGDLSQNLDEGYSKSRKAIDTAKQSVNTAKKTASTVKKTGEAATKAVSFIASNPVIIMIVAALAICVVFLGFIQNTFFSYGSKDDEKTDIYDICIDYADITKDFKGDGFEWVAPCREEIHAMRENATFYSETTQEDVDNGGYAWDVTDPLFGKNPEGDGSVLLSSTESNADYGTANILDVYPTSGNETDGYKTGVIVATNANGRKKTIRMSSYYENGNPFAYTFDTFTAGNKSESWEKLSDGYYTPISIVVYDNVKITSLPFTEAQRNSLAPDSYQNYIDSKPSMGNSFNVSLGDLTWLYDHVEQGTTQIKIHDDDYNGSQPKARISVGSTAHLREALASSVLFTNWFEKGKSIIPSGFSVDWKEYGKCFTGDDFMASNYNSVKDQSWSNLNKYLGITLKSSQIEEIIEFAKQIDGYVTEQTSGDVDMLFEGQTKLMPYSSAECQELWNQIFSDHYNNSGTLAAGWWHRLCFLEMLENLRSWHRGRKWLGSCVQHMPNISE